MTVLGVKARVELEGMLPFLEDTGASSGTGPLNDRKGGRGSPPNLAALHLVSSYWYPSQGRDSSTLEILLSRVSKLYSYSRVED